MKIITSYPCRKTNYTSGRRQPIKYIVIHYVGAEGSAQQNAKYFSRADAKASAHYFVGHADEDAKIYSSVNEADTAWHCGAKTYVHPECRNANSIGIELCCHKDAAGKWYFDDLTVSMALELVKSLMVKHNISANHILRHYDVTHKICPEPFVRDASKWSEFKAALVAEPVALKYDFKSLQKLIKVEQDNIPGPITLAACPTLRKGNNGDVVKWMQRRLNYLNYSVGEYGADGDFGPDTDAAVRKYQKDQKLFVDGIVGKQTWSKLLNIN